MSGTKVGQVYKHKETGHTWVVTSVNPTKGVCLEWLRDNHEHKMSSIPFRPGAKGYVFMGNALKITHDLLDALPFFVTIDGTIGEVIGGEDEDGDYDTTLGFYSCGRSTGNEAGSYGGYTSTENMAAIVCDRNFKPVLHHFDVTPEYDKKEPKQMTKISTDTIGGAIMSMVDEALGTRAESFFEAIKDNTITRAELTKIINSKVEELKLPVNLSIKMPTETEFSPVEGLTHSIFPVILQAVSAGIHPMVVGPAGSGKTTIAEQVAEKLGLEVYHTGAVRSEHKLIGYKDAAGNLHRTPFREAFEKGGLFLFDEIDSSHPEAVVTFNAALSNGKHDFPDGVIKAHPDFKCIAAANTFGRGADRLYVGRNQLDAASLDRFVVFNMDYDESLELALVPEEFHSWVRYVQSARKAVDKSKVRHVISPRASIFGAKLLSVGLDKKLVEESVLWKGLDEANKRKVIAEIRS